MNVLVTGGNGFLGRHIISQLLKEGHHVSSLSRNKSDELSKLGVQQFQVNINARKEVLQITKGFDAIIHCAAKVGISGPYREYFKNNVIGTKNIVDSCLKNRIPRLIYTSTPSVVLGGAPIEGGDENLAYPKNFLNPYQKSKAQAEKIIQMASNTGKLNTTILRPHIIWGPGDINVFPRVLERAKNGKLRIVGDGKNKVSSIYVENAAYAHLLALNNPKTYGKTYFLNDEKPIELWPWINSFLQELELPQIKRKIPFLMAYLLGGLLEKTYSFVNKKTEPPLTRYLAYQFSKNHYFKIEALKKDLGYSPIVSAQVARERTLEFFKEKLKYA